MIPRAGAVARSRNLGQALFGNPVHDSLTHMKSASSFFPMSDMPALPAPNRASRVTFIRFSSSLVICQKNLGKCTKLLALGSENCSIPQYCDAQLLRQQVRNYLSQIVFRSSVDQIYFSKVSQWMILYSAISLAESWKTMFSQTLTKKTWSS